MDVVVNIVTDNIEIYTDDFVGGEGFLSNSDKKYFIGCQIVDKLTTCLKKINTRGI